MSKFESFFLNTKLRQGYFFVHAGTIYFKTITELTAREVFLIGANLLRFTLGANLLRFFTACRSLQD